MKRMFARKGKGPEPFDRLPVVLALLASYDRDVRGATNLTALVDELREDESLRRICGFTDLLPSRTTFIRALEVMEHDDNYPELEKIINRAVNDRKSPRAGIRALVRGGLDGVAGILQSESEDGEVSCRGL